VKTVNPFTAFGLFVIGFVLFFEAVSSFSLYLLSRFENEIKGCRCNLG
jgi:hypothetical protein